MRRTSIGAATAALLVLGGCSQGGSFHFLGGDAGEGGPDLGGGAGPDLSTSGSPSDLGTTWPTDLGFTWPTDFGTTWPTDLGVTWPTDFGVTRPSDFTTNWPTDLTTSERPDFGVARDLTTAPPDFTVLPACTPGHYNGPLMANVVIGGLPSSVTGTADLQIGPAQGGVLPIVSGTMMGSGFLGETARADLMGSLDCGALRLTATLVNGMATFSTLMIPFGGNAAADYDPASSAFINGTLSTTGITGSGMWSATYQGP
jgi:hypothetical protein